MTIVEIPEVLYHGTTLLRWNIMKKDGGFIPYHRSGLTYLTDTIEEAAVYAADIRYVLDMTHEQRKDPDFTEWLRHNYRSKPHLRSGVILEVGTSHLDKSKFELDKEDPYVDEPYRNKYSLWLGYRGNIGLKHIIACKIYPLSDWGIRRQDVQEFITNQLRENKDIGKLLERMFARELGVFNH